MLNGKKIIRTSIFGIFASLFCLGNISSATVYTGSIPGETLQDQFAGYYYTYKIDKDLNFTTIYDDIEYPFLFYTYNGEGCSNGLRALQFFWNNGQIYTFGNYRDNTIFGQGYLKYMCKSDTTDFKTYCLGENTDSNYTTDINELYETTINFNELYVDNLVTGNQNPSCYGGQLAVCFVSDSTNIVYCIKKSIARGFTDNLTQGNLISQYGVLPSNYQNAINNNVYGESPLDTIAGGDGETTTETTTILGQCPRISDILSTYGSEYNTGICYSAKRLLTQTGIVNTTAQSIFELYPTFTDRLQDYNYYKQYCDNVPTSVCREAFSGNEIKWSLLNKTPQDNPIAIYQYCHLQLNIQDKNATTCVLSTGAYYATGVNEAIIEEIQGNQSVLDIMLNSFNNLKEELPSFSSGTVFDEFLEEGETWKDGFKLDIFKTFLELWSKITSIFIFRHQYDGIIPTYITSIIVIILLFKILKK